ncbi:MAG: R3H domain-containing nucleic acid-binding protein [Candidatus Eisenbacteria bacterium]
MTMPLADDGTEGGDNALPAVNLADSQESFTAEAPSAPGASRGDGERGRRPESAEAGAPLLSGDALAAEGKRWTEQMLSAMGFEATLRATADGDRVTVVATIEDGENLIAGERDEVRQAMQQILNRMINQGEGSRYHLQLEINDFWEKRETDLKALAQRLAAEALETNTEVMTDYLNSQERRIIHVTLRDDTRVKTYALGIGHIKRLAVAPADFPGGPVGES